MLKFLNNEYSESRRNIRRFVMSNPEKKENEKKLFIISQNYYYSASKRKIKLIKQWVFESECHQSQNKFRFSPDTCCSCCTSDPRRRCRNACACLRRPQPDLWCRSCCCRRPPPSRTDRRWCSPLSCDDWTDSCATTRKRRPASTSRTRRTRRKSLRRSGSTFCSIATLSSSQLSPPSQSLSLLVQLMLSQSVENRFWDLPVVKLFAPSVGTSLKNVLTRFVFRFWSTLSLNLFLDWKWEGKGFIRDKETHNTSPGKCWKKKKLFWRLSLSMEKFVFIVC